MIYEWFKNVDFMHILPIIIIIFGVGLFLYLYVFKQDLLFRRPYRKRSGRDRRKKFISSKNQMRRSGKDRRNLLSIKNETK